MDGTGRILAGLLACVLLVPSVAAQRPGDPNDLKPIQQLVNDEVLPVPREVYGDTACAYVGGSVVNRPPVIGESGLLRCSDPWCHPWLVVSVMCFDLERFRDPDRRYSGLCVVYQTVTPESVAVPYQTAMDPIEARCIDPLRHNSVYGGVCGSAVQLSCMTDDSDCFAYSTMTGCTNDGSGECSQPVQALCITDFDPANGDWTPVYCILWVDVDDLDYCLTFDPSSSENGGCTDPVQVYCVGPYQPPEGDPFYTVCLVWIGALRICVPQ